MDGADENQMGGRVAEQQRFIAKALRGNVTAGMLAKMMAVYNQIDLSGDLASLRQPVALLLGESGRAGAKQPMTRASIDAFRAVCPHAELITIPGAGNTFTVIEKPEETAAKIREFLRRA
jgi:pimeloyl-ACP methyl ester carboxylesterase